MKGKIKHILKAIASGLIWGLGQVFNKQYLKALFFFVFFALFLLIEIGSSKLVSGYDPYEEQLTGENFSELMARDVYNEYVDAVDDRKINNIQSFNDYYEKVKSNGFTNDELIEYIALDILAGSKTKYYSFSEYITSGNKDIDRESDLLPGEDDTKINTLKGFSGYTTTYLNETTGKEYYMKNFGTSSDPNNKYVNIDNEEEILTKEDAYGFVVLSRNNKIYYDNETKSKFYLEVIKNNEVFRYENVTDRNDQLVKLDSTLYTVIPSVKGAIYYVDNSVYIYYNPEINNYKKTEFTTFLSEIYFPYYYGKGGNDNDQTDFARFKLKVYFAMHPEVKEEFEVSFSNFFAYKAGFFLKGIWSIITLGCNDDVSYYQIQRLNDALDSSKLSGMVIDKLIVVGHVSSFLLIKGLISTLLLMYFLIIFIWSIRDAYKTSIEYEHTKMHISDKEYFKELYDHTFEYIVLFPAIFTITFISVMPILFSFLVAFTSYSGQASDVGLVKWVGFTNFIKIFNYGGDAVPFGQTFWKVFIWTVIWAVFSTLTVFFGGFFQAVIINSDRVPLKKFWRTLLILPWAIPAIISQMVFANIFNEYGVVNHFLENIGAYDIFKSWGILGVKFSEITSNIQKAFYLGESNIQWFTNPFNPWFVRIVLIVVNIWMGFPYYMALMSGIMTSIDKTLYEAADIDGAGKGQKFKYVTFPLVMQSTAPLLVMCFSGNFNNFGMIYFVTQGGNGKGDVARAYAGDTDILLSWMYTLTVDYKNYNMASVFSILIFIIVGSISAWNYSRTKAFKED